jgi:hypothetical protein
MTEILTESFCERCGTRYTFESAQPRRRLKGVTVISRGLKNFVMSDGTSMDEAMAAARSETDREATASQLDAFHKTFNFCMQCRQYTCPNCWNEAEARCLTCAPHLGHEIMPAPFPQLEPSPTDNGDLARPIAANGHDVASHPVAEIDTVARLAALTRPADEVVGPTTTNGNGMNGSTHDPDVVDAVQRLAALTGPVVDVRPDEVDIVAIEPTPPRRDEPSWDMDAELEAFELRRDASAAQAATVPEATSVDPAVVDAAPEPEPEAVVAEPEPEAVVAEPEPEAVVAEPEPVVVAEPEPVALQPEPEAVVAEPVATESPTQSPIVADVVAQPVWHMVAPDPSVPGPTTPQSAPTPAVDPTVNPGSEPQWPTRPSWLAGTPANGLPFLDRPAAPQGGMDALWAASAQDVVSPKGPKAGGGVQPCLSCGLSLSATARFCRRCGTPQAG